MTTNNDVAKDFVYGSTTSKSGNMYIENNVLYSYGKHFPMAIRLSSDKGYYFIVNGDKYSPTTSRHQSFLARYLPSEKVFVKDTDYLRSLIPKIQILGINDFKDFIAELCRDK